MLDCRQRNYFRHGDVLIKEIDNVVTGWLSQERTPLVTDTNKVDSRPLAYGEKTGHAHTVKNGEVTFFEREGTLYMQVESDNATITHQEHPDLEVPKGFTKYIHSKNTCHPKQEV